MPYCVIISFDKIIHKKREKVMSLAGRLEDLGLADVFQILSIGKKSGTLVLKTKDRNAIVVFKMGLVVRAETDIFNNTIGDELVKEGIVSESILQLARESKKILPDKSIPEILFELGAVSKDILDRVAKKRIEKVIYELMLWQDGEFEFEVDEVNVDKLNNIMDTGWEVSKGISPEYLLMEGARVYDESIYQDIGITDEVFEKESKGSYEEWMISPLQERRDISQLKSLSFELRFPSSASEITLLILRFASDIFQRGVLFMVGDDEIVGLGQFGLDIDKADIKIRQVRLPLMESRFLKEIVRQGIVYKGALQKDRVTESFIKILGGRWPGEVAFFPVIAEGKVVAMLYADNLPTNEPFSHTEGLEIFINQAGLALEKALLERRLKESRDD